jgi:hypothetical protein
MRIWTDDVRLLGEQENEGSDEIVNIAAQLYKNFPVVTLQEIPPVREWNRLNTVHCGRIPTLTIR